MEKNYLLVRTNYSTTTPKRDIWHPIRARIQRCNLNSSSRISKHLCRLSQSLWAVVWCCLIKVAHNETVACGSIYKIQSLKKQSGSQRVPNYFSWGKRQKTLSDNHFRVTSKSKEAFVRSRQYFPTSEKMQKHRGRGGGGAAHFSPAVRASSWLSSAEQLQMSSRLPSSFWWRGLLQSGG